MTHHVSIPLALALVFVFLRASLLNAQTTRPTEKNADDARFLRFEGDSTKSGTLETSEYVYKNDDSVRALAMASLH